MPPTTTQTPAPIPWNAISVTSAPAAPKPVVATPKAVVTPTATPTPVPPVVTPSPVTPTGTTLTQDQAKAARQNTPGFDAMGDPIPGYQTPTPTTPTSTSTSASTTPTDTTAPTSITQQQLDQAQADYQAQATKVSDTITNISNGSVPLNLAEQAQVDGLKAQFQTLIDQQTLANKSATGIGLRLGYQGGAGENPIFHVNTIGSIVTAGINKVADLMTKEASAVAQLTTSFRNEDIKAVQSAWDIYQKAFDERQTALQKTITDAQQAIKDAQDAQQKITDDVNKIQEDVLKNTGDSVLAATVGKAGSVSAALTLAGDALQTGTGDVGDYLQYKRQVKLAGGIPTDFDTWKKNKDAADTKAAAAKAYATSYATESAKSQFAGSSQNQQKLEQQYRVVLEKELSNRSGGFGLQDQKVNQAIHLRALYDQYYDPKTGNYNVPTAQYGELVLGLANLLSAAGTTSDADRAELRSKTAVGDLKGALQYITGTPQNGNSQQIIKNLVDSINRQGTVAEQERGQYLQFIHGLAPTDLDPDRQMALEKNSLNSFANPKNDPMVQTAVDAKKSVDDFVKQNPKTAETIANLYSVPGATDADIEEYIGMHPELAQ